jgi:hypothetical protein
MKAEPGHEVFLTKVFDDLLDYSGILAKFGPANKCESAQASNPYDYRTAAPNAPCMPRLGPALNQNRAF